MLDRAARRALSSDSATDTSRLIVASLSMSWRVSSRSVSSVQLVPDDDDERRQLAEVVRVDVVVCRTSSHPSVVVGERVVIARPRA